MTRIGRWVLYLVLATVVVLAAGAGGGWLYLRQSLPQTAGEIALPALDEPVEVVRDAHHIPTIRAGSLQDAYTALGFLHAQDRLWQMDFMRRTAAGRLSEVVGEGTLGIDRFMRLMGLYGQAEAQRRDLDAETLAALEAYADGVNAYLDRDPVLPPEFHLLGYEPEPWTITDSLTWLRLMALRLSGNWRSEIQRARLIDRLGPEKAQFFEADDPADAPTTIEGGDVAGLPADGLRQLAGLLPYALQPKSASNAWVVDGDRTAGGQPILANDPHLGLQAPGYWYLARIETPDRTLVGATAPGMPFHVLGRNDDVAWGLTTTHGDVQDLFVEKLAPGHAEAYLTPDGPRPFETRESPIPVDGQDAPVPFTVRSTRHGPVISDSVEAAEAFADEGRVLALAWPALTARDRTPDALRRLNAAANVDEAMAAADLVTSPQQNVFLADRRDDIAVVVPGRVPVRRQGDGTVPVPGWSGAYDWIGTIPADELPRRLNPPDGRLVNANNRVVPQSYPHLLAAHWPPPWRAQRIETLLDDAATPLTPDAMAAMQLDAKSPKAEILLPTLLKHPSGTNRGQVTAALLRDWDGVMDRTRPEPLLFTAWMDQLNRALFADELGGLFEAYTEPDPRRLKRAIERNSAWCDDVTTDDVQEDCAGQVQVALEDALDRLDDRFGGAIEELRWGDAHRTGLPHPMFSRIPLLAGLIGPEIATDGGDETLNRGHMTYAGSRYTDVHGPTLRAVHDLAKDPGSSLFMIADGQSGNPLSPHYAGLAEAWRDGRFVKLVGETQDAGGRLRLTPQSN